MMVQQEIETVTIDTLYKGVVNGVKEICGLYENENPYKPHKTLLGLCKDAIQIGLYADRTCRGQQERVNIVRAIDKLQSREDARGDSFQWSTAEYALIDSVKTLCKPPHIDGNCCLEILNHIRKYREYDNLVKESISALK